MSTSQLMMVGILAFNAGIFCQKAIDEHQRKDSERGPYKIRIEERIDNRHWWTHKLDNQGIPVGDQWLLASCPHEDNPAFDVGRCYKVRFELSSTNLGYCETFTGDNAQADPVRCDQ